MTLKLTSLHPDWDCYHPLLDNIHNPTKILILVSSSLSHCCLGSDISTPLKQDALPTAHFLMMPAWHSSPPCSCYWLRWLWQHRREWISISAFPCIVVESAAPHPDINPQFTRLTLTSCPQISFCRLPDMSQGCSQGLISHIGPQTGQRHKPLSPDSNRGSTILFEYHLLRNKCTSVHAYQEWPSEKWPKELFLLQKSFLGNRFQWQAETVPERVNLATAPELQPSYSQSL